MTIISLYSWIETQFQSLYEIFIPFLQKLEVRDYLTGFSILLTISLAFWNACNTQEKFETQNYPVLKAELEFPPYPDNQKLFPIYPNYKITNIGDKKAVDIRIEVKIQLLKNRYKFWKKFWLERTVAKFDNLEPKAELKLNVFEYSEEFRILKGKLSRKILAPEYTEQKYIENFPIKSIINVYYCPVLYHARELKLSKTYNLIVQRNDEINFTQLDLFFLIPSLVKLNNKKVFLSIIYQLLMYQSLLPKLELEDKINYNTHYWKLQETKHSWEFPFSPKKPDKIPKFPNKPKGI